MQAKCDANMFFMDVVCKYPGSSYDSFILRQSNIHSNFENGYYGDGILLGDSDYPLKSWLMTPIAAPSSAAEIRCNQAHKKCRSIIEK